MSQSGAHLRNNCQMADYVSKIFSGEADALISDAGRERAQAFAEGGEAAEPDKDDLDFDVAQANGPGAALARAMRSSALGVWADVDNPKAKSGAAASENDEDEPLLVGDSPGAGRAGRGTSASDAAAGEGAGTKAEAAPSSRALAETTAGHGSMTQPPDSSRRTVFIGLALFLAAMVGLFLWLWAG